MIKTVKQLYEAIRTGDWRSTWVVEWGDVRVGNIEAVEVDDPEDDEQYFKIFKHNAELFEEGHLETLTGSTELTLMVAVDPKELEKPRGAFAVIEILDGSFTEQSLELFEKRDDAQAYYEKVMHQLIDEDIPGSSELTGAVLEARYHRWRRDRDEDDESRDEVILLPWQPIQKGPKQ